MRGSATPPGVLAAPAGGTFVVSPRYELTAGRSMKSDLLDHYSEPGARVREGRANAHARYPPALHRGEPAAATPAARHHAGAARGSGRGRAADDAGDRGWAAEHEPRHARQARERARCVPWGSSPQRRDARDQARSTAQTSRRHLTVNPQYPHLDSPQPSAPFSTWRIAGACVVAASDAVPRGGELGELRQPEQPRR